jgi:F0F1-type ATP synthase assembly protein I
VCRSGWETLRPWLLGLGGVLLGLAIGNMLPELSTPAVVILLLVGILFAFLGAYRRKKAS